MDDHGQAGASVFGGSPRLRLVAVLLGSVAGIWLIAIVAGVFGFRPLPDLPFVSDAPLPAGLVLQAAPDPIEEPSPGPGAARARPEHDGPGDGPAAPASADASPAKVVTASATAPDVPSTVNTSHGNGGGGTTAVPPDPPAGGGKPSTASGPPPSSPPGHAGAHGGPPPWAPGASVSAAARGHGKRQAH